MFQPNVNKNRSNYIYYFKKSGQSVGLTQQSKVSWAVWEYQYSWQRLQSLVQHSGKRSHMVCRPKPRISVLDLWFSVSRMKLHLIIYQPFSYRFSKLCYKIVQKTTSKININSQTDTRGITEHCRNQKVHSFPIVIPTTHIKHQLHYCYGYFSLPIMSKLVIYTNLEQSLQANQECPVAKSWHAGLVHEQ